MRGGADRGGCAGFFAFNGSALIVFSRLLRCGIALTPIGTASLIGEAVIRYGWSSLSALGTFAGAVYIGLALVLFVVYPPLLLANGLSSLRFFGHACPAIQLGVVSRSSVGTLPVTGKRERTSARRPARLCSLRGPARRYDKMDRCAVIYPALLAIDPILDMGRTAANVAGQALVPTIVAERTGILDLRFRAGSPRICHAGTRVGLIAYGTLPVPNWCTSERRHPNDLVTGRRDR